MTKMQTPMKQTRRRCAGGHDARGSAIVLVLVSMVLMAILAGSLLQLTRFERIPRSESNIEVVIESVIAEILNQATNDLLDDAGNYLNSAAAAGGYDEPHDFPWTNRTVTGERQPENRLGVAQTNVLGGRLDDTWLAAHMPDFGGAPGASTAYTGGTAGGTNGTWRKITSLTGIYLGGTGGSSDFSGMGNPNEYNVSNLNVALNSDTNIATGSALLVDADGDGIGDSRYEWAPLRQVGATQYVMAVRIVDLSARMDANVALGSTPSPNNTGAISYSTANPRGDGPTELDGAAFIARLGELDTALAVDAARLDWRKSVGFRLTANAATGGIAASPGYMNYDGNAINPSAGTRREYWSNGASRVSNTFGRNDDASVTGLYDYSEDATFGFVDAFELLQGNGVGSANATTIEDLMPNVLRRNAGTGGQEGTFATGTPPRSWNQLQFWSLDARKHISPFTGAAGVAKPYAVGQDRSLKLDVNEAVQTTAGRAQLRSRINTFLTNANGSSLAAAYPHLADVGEMADQLTANIADYIDDDNLLTISGSNAGFEVLPYITEVYLQRPYSVQSITPGSDATGAFKDVVWEPAPNSTTGFAIEIGNPFGRLVGGSWVGRPVQTDNVWLKVGSNTEVELSTLTGMPALIQPGEVVVVYVNSAGGNATLDDLTNLWTTTTGNASIAASVSFNPAGFTMPDDQQFISLHAEDQDAAGSALSWYYSACRALFPFDDIDERIRDGDPDFPIIATDTSYVQTNYRGVGLGLRMMALQPGTNAVGFTASLGTTTEPSLNRNDGTGVAELDNITPEFANEAKTGASTAFGALADQQIVWPDNPRERMHWVGDILQIPLIGCDAGGSGNATTMGRALRDAGMDSSTNGIVDLMLPYDAGPVVHASNNNGTLNFPVGLMLLEQLTTFNPATDGENGDGSSPAGAESVTANGSGDNDSEVLIPGKLNLNTAPFDTLVRLLPFPDEVTRRAIATAIVTRRESTVQSTTYSMGQAGYPGIAHVSALYNQLANLADGTVTGYTNTSTDGADTTTLGAASTRIDLTDHETAIGTYVGADGIADDREEEIMLAKWLAEMTDTRSDVFAAYIVVQGYPSGNFGEGATESARLIIIFSRANVKGAGDRAVELGRFRIN